jgi:hypothetical protein
LAGTPVRWVLPVVAVSVLAACGYGSASSTTSGITGQSGTESSTVEIGLPRPSDLAALGAALGGGLGVSGASAPTDQQVDAFYQAMVSYVNSHAGLLGKKITPVYFSINPISLAGSSVQQEMCTEFTQDNHVFAVMDLPNVSQTFISCLENAKVIAFDPAGSVQLDDTSFAQNPLYATAGALSLSRVASVEVNGLFKQGFFGSSPKIGLVGYNTPSFTRAISQSLKPALAAHGLHLTDQQLVAPVASLSDVAATQQAISDAVLRFKSEGIDHVLFFDTEGGTVSPWTQAATAQNYFPRLGLTTNELPSEQAYLGNTRNPDQGKEYSTALGVGWSPVSDEANPPVNATGQLCDSIMAAAGASAAQAKLFWSTCDELLVFAAGVNAGGQLTSTDALSGLAKAKSLQSAELAGPPNYAGGRRDGVGSVRYLSFASKCQCFQYSSNAVSVQSLLTNG